MVFTIAFEDVDVAVEELELSVVLVLTDSVLVVAGCSDSFFVASVVVVVFVVVVVVAVVFVVERKSAEPSVVEDEISTRS